MYLRSHYRDARLLAVGINSKQKSNNPFCKVCKDDGALLMCSHCERSFHLKCLKLTETDVPAYYWACSRCAPLQEKTFKKEICLSRQQKQKEKHLRKLWTKLTQRPKPRTPSKLAPRAKPLPVPCTADLVYVCDFVSTFSEALHLTPFTLDQLHTALSTPSLVPLLQETLMSCTAALLSTLPSHFQVDEAFD